MTENLVIDKYSPDKDREKVRAMISPSYTSELARAELNRRIEDLERPSAKVNIARDAKNGTVVGFIESTGFGNCGLHIEHAFVGQGSRNKKVFTSMLERVLEKAGNKTVTAQINPTRHHMSTLQRMGFESDGTEVNGLVTVTRKKRKNYLFF